MGSSVFCEVGVGLFSITEVHPMLPRVTLSHVHPMLPRVIISHMHPMLPRVTISHISVMTPLNLELEQCCVLFWHLLHLPLHLFSKFRDDRSPSSTLHYLILLHASAKSQNIILQISILQPSAITNILCHAATKSRTRWLKSIGYYYLRLEYRNTRK